MGSSPAAAWPLRWWSAFARSTYPSPTRRQELRRDRPSQQETPECPSSGVRVNGETQLTLWFEIFPAAWIPRGSGEVWTTWPLFYLLHWRLMSYQL